MSNHDFALNGTALTATATGALWIEDTQTLCVSDLHLGKSGRIARRSGTLIPPYETQDTLSRLGDVVAQFNPKTVSVSATALTIWTPLKNSRQTPPQQSRSFRQGAAGFGSRATTTRGQLTSAARI